jgi:putative tryptophan/tyrosine transport system substrate-binding protein
MMQQITETASRLADTALADKPVYGNQTLGNRIDGQKKTFKGHGTEQRKAVGCDEALSSDFVTVQSQTCLRHGPNVALPASDHDALRPSRLQFKPFRQGSGYYGKSSAGVHKQLDLFNTSCRTRQTCLYVEKSHVRYLFENTLYCNLAQEQRNSRALATRKTRKKCIGSSFTRLALIVLLFAFNLTAEAQQTKKLPRIGYLTTSFAAEVTGRVDALRQGLRELGYLEGKNIVIEYRYGKGKPDRLPALAAELIDLKVAVIVTHGFPPAQAAKRATTTIPIVMAVIGDAVGAWLVASLARPGGNITGLTSISSELYGKRLELLREVSPKISRVAILSSEKSPATEIAMNEIRGAANALGIQLQTLQVRSPNDFESAFDSSTKGGAGGLIVLQGPLTSTYRKRIVELAAKSRLLAAYHESEFTEAGGLMSYGVSYSDMYRRAAIYVDKILKGAKPADLPVEQPMKFELVINLKAAKQIGLTIPPNVLARADKVIR